MAESSIIGTRIRERRIEKGLRQSKLAAEAGISPSYLNLIEHNRRRIGGKILNRLAEVLDVEPNLLAEGAEATLIAGLKEAAAQHDTTPDRAGEFAARFPGWAQLLVEKSRRNEVLEQSVRTLTDRLAHDPHLAASLHDVISTVTAIRSTSSILVETKELEPEWRGRFDRNIHEESRRLADSAKSLVQYLETAPDTDADIKSPQEELDAFLSDAGYHFPALEGDCDADAVEALLDAAHPPLSLLARRLATDVLRQYLADARCLPLDAMRAAVARHGAAPEALARELGVEMAVVFRRLANMSEAEIGPMGLVICDGSGALTFRKPLRGFTVPRIAWACALWPLFQVLSRPQAPVRALLQQAGRDAEPVDALAVCEQVRPAGFTQPPLYRAHMLILPVSVDIGDQAPREVGNTCSLCTRAGCAARREPSLLAEGF